jgi:pyruvate dehydrogenase E1 component
MLAYKESTSGQILHVGINEAGSLAAFTAAGSSYATHGEPMVPIYIFYSMFGFQRTGDAMWAAGDQMCRGFVVGATAGRTTLTGEGLQHADGHSPLLASTNPAVVAYDPAYGYEIAHIVKDGLRRMYGESPENIYYYLTVYNEPIVQPAEPVDLDVEGLLKGMYVLRPAAAVDEASGLVAGGPRAQILASGVAVPWALEAQEMLARDWGVAADVWSVTSWNELRRDGLACDEAAFTHLDRPVVAVSDYMRAVPDQIRQWVPQDFRSLGADGFGLSDTRAATRRHFKIDSPSIVTAVLQQLGRRGEYRAEAAAEAAQRYRLLDVTARTTGSAGGDA